MPIKQTANPIYNIDKQVIKPLFNKYKKPLSKLNLTKINKTLLKKSLSAKDINN